jgi:hypothetical protein
MLIEQHTQRARVNLQEAACRSTLRAARPVGHHAHEGLRLGVQVGGGEPCAGAGKGTRAASGAAVLVGDADDQSAPVAQIDGRGSRGLTRSGSDSFRV